MTRAETFPKIWIRIRAILGYVVTEPRHAMSHLVHMGVHRGEDHGKSALTLLKFDIFDVKCCFHKKCPKIVARAFGAEITHLSKTCLKRRKIHKNLRLHLDLTKLPFSEQQWQCFAV